MHKVNWSAKQDFEFIQNYKILQTCFTKLHIDRVSYYLFIYLFF